jgi:curved DNA-binding protein CbpA
MGNTTGKQQSYQQYYESMNNNQSNDIELSGLDPYKVLNVPKNFTWEQLKKGYKNAALKTHPDKEGGNKVIFDFVTSCFETLADEYNLRVSNKKHTDLKNESKNYFDKMVNNDVPHPSTLVDQNEPFNQRFNKVFDDCKYRDEEVEYGYGGMMANSTDKREEISITNVFNGQKVNNTTFNEVFNKNTPVSKSVIKYKEPEALLMAKNLQFTEIGSKRPDDYSSGTEKSSLRYTDYMVAYSGERLANPDDIKNRKEFKSVKEYQKYRETKSKKELTSKEKQLLEKKKLQEEKEEFNRLERIKMQNAAIAQAHEKANRLMIR